MGGKARAEALSEEERAEIAKKAAVARWAIPKATHTGNLKIGEAMIECHVLQDGTRLLSRISVLKAIGRTGKAKGGRAYDEEFGLPVFLTANNLKPFITAELTQNSNPVKFIPAGGGTASLGYKAEILPQICTVFIDAHDAEQTTAMQEHIVQRCKILLRGFAVVGINALVDEATGYQEVRDRLALQKILEKYVTDEWSKWTRRFPNDFYRHLFRLKGMPFPPHEGTKKPSYVGHWTNDVIYSRLAPGVLKKLREVNPKTPSGARSRKHHQHLSEEIGIPELEQLLSNVVFLMRGCQTWQEFKQRLDISAPKYGDTMALPLLPA
jgi:hypothetical protein